ncbi:MAG: GatB/YqeY domain-containing protein [Actinobacteria bacterium]|nr:GatB/YqeY domain-containing protein [Actinomycetota bacterium]
MSLLEQIKARVTESLKTGGRDHAASLRVLVSELQAAAKEARRPLTEEEELQVLRRERKKRQESAEAFRSGGREELAAKEEWMLALIDEMLPKQMDEESLMVLIEQVIADVGATSLKQMGKVMSAVMAKGGAQVDGSLASRLVKERLTA